MFLISMHLEGISVVYEKRSRVDLIWERASSLKLKKINKSQSDPVFPKMEILKLNEKYMFVFLTVPSAPNIDVITHPLATLLLSLSYSPRNAWISWRHVMNVASISTVVRCTGVKQVTSPPPSERALPSGWAQAHLDLMMDLRVRARGDYPDKLPLNSPDGQNLVYGGRRPPAFRAENGDNRSTQPEGKYWQKWASFMQQCKQCVCCTDCRVQWSQQWGLVG